VIDTCHFHFNLTLFLKTHKIQIVENPAGALGSTGYFGFHTGWNEQAVSVCMCNLDIIKTEAVKSPPETSQQAEAVKPTQFLVIARGKVVHVSADNVESCKEFLNKNYGRGVALPQRMVCRNGVVVDDPHTCGGQNQGGGVCDKSSLSCHDSLVTSVMHECTRMFIM
jgi:hypothetical protein